MNNPMRDSLFDRPLRVWASAPASHHSSSGLIPYAVTFATGVVCSIHIQVRKSAVASSAPEIGEHKSVRRSGGLVRRLLKPDACCKLVNIISSSEVPHAGHIKQL